MKRLIAAAILALVVPAAGQWYEKTAWLPDSIYGIEESNLCLYNPATNRLYFANGDNGNLQVLDAVFHRKIGFIEDFGLAASLVHAPASHRIYAVLPEEEEVAVLDDQTDSVVAVLTVPEPFPAAYNPRLDKVYVGSQHNAQVYVFDPGPDTLLTTVETVDDVVALVFDSLTNRLFALSEGDAGVTVIDGAADTVLGCLPVPAGTGYALDANFALRKLYCLGEGRNPGHVELWSYDMDSLEVLARLAMPDAWDIGSGQLLVNPASDYIYAGYWESPVSSRDLSEDSVAVVDCRTDSLVGFVCLPGGRGLHGLGVSTMHNKVYMSTWNSDSVAVLAVPDSITGWVQLPASVAGFAWCPADGNLYCPGEDDFLYILDPAGDSVAGTVDYTMFEPIALTWNPAGNKLYVTNFRGIVALGPGDSLAARTFLRWNGYFGPHGYSAELNRYYLADLDLPRLYLYDCNRDSVIACKYLPKRPYYPGVTIDRYHRLFLPAFGGEVVVYDTYADSVVATLDAVGSSLFYNPRADRIYGCTADAIRVLDPVSLSIVAEIPIDIVRSLVINTVDNELYVLSGDAGKTIFVVDAATNSVIHRFEMPSGQDLTIYWVDRWNQLVAAAESTVYVCDCPARQVDRTVPYPTGFRAGPGAFLWNARNDKLYIRGDAGVAVMRLPQDTIIAWFSSRRSYHGIAWNAVANRVYISGNDNIVVLADDPYGMAEEQTGNPANRLEIRGNPSGGVVQFGLNLLPGQVGHLRVYNPAGRLVWERTAAGAKEVVWRCADRRGRTLEPGIYLCTLEAGDFRAMGKLVLTSARLE